MTTEQALFNFFSGFGLPAFADTAVPDSTPLPYLEYEVITDTFGGETVYPSVRIWYRGEGEADANAKAKELSNAIGDRGILLPCDSGYIWINRGSPFCRNISGTDNNIKGRFINIAVRYLTL